ncbi:MAG: hypothetical protein JWN79_3295 [Gemmatimonadetes bacterium]|jgi:hypothetical protein|nr:hypothetical protein [Gemmatimonadota bacterium]
MKGGKGGRRRRPSSSTKAASGGARGKPKKANETRPANAAPKKGSRKKTFGAVPTADDA